MSNARSPRAVCSTTMGTSELLYTSNGSRSRMVPLPFGRPGPRGGAGPAIGRGAASLMVLCGSTDLPGKALPEKRGTAQAAVAAASSSGATVRSVTLASSSMKSTTFSSNMGDRRFSAACGVLRKNSSTCCSWPG